jgi:hypothetical protein
MGAEESARLTLNALMADGVHVPGMEQLQPFMKDGQLLALHDVDRNSYLLTPAIRTC